MNSSVEQQTIGPEVLEEDRKGVSCLFCANPRRSENSDYCHTCWAEKERTEVEKKPVILPPKPLPIVTAPEACTSCKRKGKSTPAAPGSGYCAECCKKITQEARLRDKIAHSVKCSICNELPAVDPENGVTKCYKCTHHGPTIEKKQAGSLDFPDECLHGWIGDFAKQLNCPLSAAYPAALALAAGYGVPSDKRVRTTLYVTILGKTRVGKSVTKDRALESWAPPSESQVVTAYPGSEIGLIQILGGKKAKDMTQDDYRIQVPYLLVQDEMRLTFGKIAIQNSALPNALNEMFYKDSFETAAKQGRWTCSAKLSILGCLTCANPDEFADIYGVDTATGLYGRTIFGIVPPGWDFDFATWQAPIDADGNPGLRRRPKGCKVSAEAFRMANEWAREDLAARADLKELALRIALITSSLNHEDLVSEDAIRRALIFMEWQQSLRDRYRPSEMDTPSGKCQQAIVRALEHYEDWVVWRDLCLRHSLYKNKAWDATILNRVKRAMVFESMLEEETEDGDDSKPKKTGRVRLVK